mgnify:CR=1 FL=1
MCMFGRRAETERAEQRRTVLLQETIKASHPLALPLSTPHVPSFTPRMRPGSQHCSHSLAVDEHKVQALGVGEGQLQQLHRLPGPEAAAAVAAAVTAAEASCNRRAPTNQLGQPPTTPAPPLNAHHTCKTCRTRTCPAHAYAHDTPGNVAAHTPAANTQTRTYLPVNTQPNHTRKHSLAGADEHEAAQ